MFGDGSVCLRTHLTHGVLAHRPSPKAGPTIHRVESIKTQLEGRDHITARAALNSVILRHRMFFRKVITFYNLKLEARIFFRVKAVQAYNAPPMKVRRPCAA